jgi:hypothetical protein
MNLKKNMLWNPNILGDHLGIQFGSVFCQVHFTPFQSSVCQIAKFKFSWFHYFAKCILPPVKSIEVLPQYEDFEALVKLFECNIFQKIIM